MGDLTSRSLVKSWILLGGKNIRFKKIKGYALGNLEIIICFDVTSICVGSPVLNISQCMHWLLDNFCQMNTIYKFYFWAYKIYFSFIS